MCIKISFAANYLVHHQIPFSNKLIELTNNNYTYIECEPLPEYRTEIGYENLSELPFVTKIYEDEIMRKKAMDKIANDDMVIFGSCPDECVDLRKKSGKPYIIYSERLLKNGYLRRFIPSTRRKIKKRYGTNGKDNMFVLCSSAYLPYDLSLINLRPKAYKWGYFPKVQEYDDIDTLIQDKEKNSILWVARFLSLKHPEVPVKIAERLKKDGISFNLNMIGVGDEFEKTKKLIKRKNLSDCVHLLGSMSTAEVRRYMEKSEIFLFTSNKKEGWGAVLNESMNSACAVVASNEIGSAPFLIDNNENGYMYRHGNIDDIYEKVKFLINNPSERIKMSKKAYATITDLWNAETATTRLYSIIEARIKGENEPVYQSGPCSVADIIKEDFIEK